MLRRLVVLFTVLTLAAHGEQREQPLFVMVLQPLKAGEAPFDVAKLGGKLEHRSGSRLAVRLPEAALEAVERNPQVRYIQRVWLGVPAQQRGPSNMAAAMSMAAGPVAHSSPSWTTGVYTYDGSGNVASIISSTQTNTYAYDHLGRLAEASVASGGTTHPEAYAYDVAGNLTQITQGSVVIDLPVEAATNRLTPSLGVQYDAAGHMILDPLNTWYRYDQLGMIADDGALTYVYNADDERIGTAVISGDWNGVTWHWTLRDGNGRRIRQFDSFGGVDGVASFIWSEDEFHDGQRLVAVEREEAEGGRRYFHQDHLGTTRLTTNSAGQVISGHDYYPFGTEITSVRQERVRGYEREQAFRFTGHERDGLDASNAEHSVYLDYMHARYYNPNWGRFLSPDPGRDWDVREPQSWNMYAYVTNNPLKFTDPEGRYRTFYKEKSLGEADVANAPPIIKLAFNIQGGLLLAGSGRIIRDAYTIGRTVTRYMCKKEADKARESGNIPNTNEQGDLRPTHVTADQPVNSSQQAQQVYELPVTPTHRATVPRDRVQGPLQPAPSGRNASGGGGQATTSQPIPVKPNEIKPLDHSIWDRVVNFFVR